MDSSISLAENLPPPKYQYHRLKEIYNHPLVKKVNRNNLQKFNFYGKYLDHKPGLLILEDFSLDCICKIKIDDATEKFFEKCFYPWYVFRLHQAECTQANTNHPNNYNRAKTIFFNMETNKDAVNWIVCFSMIEKAGQIFKMHKSTSPVIEPQDNSILEDLRNIWFKTLNNVRISDLKQIKNSGTVKTSFLAQIIGIQILSSSQCVLKVWDGSKPDFDVKYPRQSSNGENVDQFSLRANMNNDLNQISSGRQCYVYLIGLSFVEQMRIKKPGNLIMFINAKIYELDKTSPLIFRIELNDHDKQECMKAFCRTFDESTVLGNMLHDKLRPYLGNNSISMNQDTSEVLVSQTQNSFDSNLSRNQISNINQFDEIVRQNVNYQVFCKIVDLFPLNYDAFDLMNLKCQHCGLEDSVNHLFKVDLDSLRESVRAFRMIYGDSKKVNCPLCFQASACFEFCIIMLLEDRVSDRCLAVINDAEAKSLFRLSTIEILSDKDKEYRFLNYLNELKEIFKDLDSNVKRSMVIKNDSEIYKIKTINHRRDLIS